MSKVEKYFEEMDKVLALMLNLEVIYDRVMDLELSEDDFKGEDLNKLSELDDEFARLEVKMFR